MTAQGRPAWLMLAALLLAVGAGVATYQYLHSLQATETVVVAARDIHPLETIERSDLRIAEMPAGSRHSQALRSVDDGVGLYARWRLHSGEQVLAEKVVSDETAGGFRATLEPSERAFFIPLNLGQGLGGALRRGDRVDLLYVGAGEDGIQVAHRLLEGVTVLAVRSEEGERYEPGTDSYPLGVVVAITPSEAEQVTFALETGVIYAAAAGTEPVPGDSPGVTWETLFGPLSTGDDFDQGAGADGR